MIINKRLEQRIRAGLKWLYESEEKESEEMVLCYLGKNDGET